MKKLLISASILVLLTGCVARQMAPMQVIYNSAFGSPTSYQNVALQEGYEYLEFQVPEGSGLLFKSYEDAVPATKQSTTKVFTAPPGAVIRLQGGLVTHFDTTVTRQWANVRTTESRVSANNQEVFTLVYDLPQQGLFNLSRQVTVTNLAPVDSLEAVDTPLVRRFLASKQPYSVKQFDFAEPTGISNGLLNSWIKKDYQKEVQALVAYNEGQAVYGYQCFTPDYCFDYLIRSKNRPL